MEPTAWTKDNPLLVGWAAPKTGYVTAALDAVRQLEATLTARYGDNWRLRMERESPGVWRCHWDILTESGEVLGGGSESFTINL